MLAAAEAAAPGLIPPLLEPDVDPAALLAEPPSDLPAAARRRCKNRDALRTTVTSWRVQADERSLTLLTPADSRYPPSLRHAPLRPLVLFAAGDVSLLARGGEAVAVIGSRTPTAYGRGAAQDFSDALTQDAAVSLWSGLAAGIDAIAHNSCLDAEVPTVAVLAGGLDHVYPARHRGLFDSILARGGLCLSELPPTARPQRGHFPRRNRILALATGAVLVIEAGAASGSLHTARFAVDAGTPVYAVPGPYTSPRSVGCHRLISDGAAIAADPESLLRDLGVGLGLGGASEVERFRHFEASADERAILDLLGDGPRPRGLLQRESRLEGDRFFAALVHLQEHARIRELDGGLFALRGRHGRTGDPKADASGVSPKFVP